MSMSNIMSDVCYDSADYIEVVAGYRPCEDVTLEECGRILEEREVCLWNYPLTEIDHIIENDINVILVRFPEDDGNGYDYRFCEIPKEG